MTPSCHCYLEVGQAHGDFLREQNRFLHGPCIRKGFVPSCLIPCSHLGCLQLVIPAAGRVQEPSTRSACLAQAAPQPSLLPAGCAETFTLCRSCHAPCLRMFHCRGRRPARVKPSWDRLFYERNFWKWALSPRFTICQEGIYHLMCQSTSRLFLWLLWRCLRTTCGRRINKNNTVNIREAALASLLALHVWKFWWDKEQHGWYNWSTSEESRPHVTGVWLCRGLWDTMGSHHNNVSSDTCYQTAFRSTTIICLLALAMLIFIINMEWIWIIYMNIK